MVQRKLAGLLRLRKNLSRRRPKFVRVESWRLIRVKPPWRKARGIDSQTKLKRKSGVKSPKIGYRGPKIVRDLHPSGYEDVKVTTIEDLKNLNKKKHAVKISSKLGAKKRIALIDHAQKLGFKILNIGISQKEMESLESALKSPETGVEDEESLDLEELEDSGEEKRT
jgi:large subunit ribosomal protein L32e